MDRWIGALNARFFRRRMGEKWLLAVALVLFVAQLVPLLAIARYDVPSADDFGFCVETRHAWEETESVSAVLNAALGVVRDKYETWQGSFTGVFLMTLRPGLIDEARYGWTPALLLGLLVGGALLLSWALLRKGHGATRAQFVLIALGWLTAFIQWMPSPADGLFWYNGGMYYVGFFALTMAFFALALLLLRLGNLRSARGGLLLAADCLLGVLIGGSNYVTAFLALLILALMLLGFGTAKKPGWKRLIPPFLALVAAFALNALAPGNACRREVIAGGMGAFQTVWEALASMMVYCREWMSVPLLVLLSMLAPVMLKVIRQSDASFEHPILMPLIAFGMVGAACCPNLYAVGGMGGYVRVVNVVYGVYLLALCFTEFYLLGYFERRIEKAREQKALAQSQSASAQGGYSAGGYLLLGAAFVLSVAILCTSNQCNMSLSSLSATRSLADGSARQYHAEAQERFALLHDEDVKEVGLAPFTVTPHVLYHGDDVKADPEYWSSVYVADFYDKDAVFLRP